MKKIGLIAIFLLALLPSIASAYTSPGKPSGFVNDFANILADSDKSQIETILSNFQKKSGNEIVIATIPSLGNETVEGYAVKLFEEWGIGKKGKDNGLLILHALNDREVWIEVGYGLEPYITDAKASLIYRNILTPAFQKGDFVSGYSEAVTAIINTLNGQIDAVPEDKGSDGYKGNWYFIFIIIPIWLASILGRTKSWWLGGVLGAIVGIVFGFIYGFLYTGIILVPVFAIVGLIFDFFVSTAFSRSYKGGRGGPPWWTGGGFGGGFGGFGGGGFGGFGGGRSGGGGGGGGY